MSAAAGEQWREKIDAASQQRKEFLNLSFCDMGEGEGHRMQYLADFLKANQSVTSLRLNNNRTIETEGMRYLSEGLAINQALKVLVVDDCGFGSEGTRLLAEGLKSNKTVQELSVGENQVGDEGMGYITELLQVNKTIKELSLADNDIGAKGMRLLSRGIKHTQTLEQLVLNDNQIDDNGMQHLIEAIRVNTSLDDVELSGNPFSDDVECDFEAALEDKTSRQTARKEYLSQLAARMIKSATKRGAGPSGEERETKRS